ncbi:MAG: ElyC/SanA/YdcF family protein [Bacteroidales bacterium]
MKKLNVLKGIKIIILLSAGLILFVLGINVWVEYSTKNALYQSAEEVPTNKVGLLPGTTKHLSNGYINLYYQYRIEAALELYQAGKIDYVLISGDNSRPSYNEPMMMKNDLIKKGIPEDKIFLDYAGFRTLDSVVRSRAIFGQSNITVISQPFHNKRAVFIAKAKNINAIGYNAKNVGRHYGFKTNLREVFARVKMMLDLVVGQQPKFYGDPIQIP